MRSKTDLLTTFMEFHGDFGEDYCKHVVSAEMRVILEGPDAIDVTGANRVLLSSGGEIRGIYAQDIVQERD